MSYFLSALILTLSAGTTQILAQTGDGVIPCPSSAVSPHIAFGGGWSTTIYVSLDYDESQTVTFYFFDAKGKPMQVPVTATTGLSGRVSEITLRMTKGTAAIELMGTDPQVSIGWAGASCTSGRAPQIVEVFRYSAPGRPDLEASVPFMRFPGTVRVGAAAAFPLDSPNGVGPLALPDLDRAPAVTFPFDSRSGLETGVAVVKPNLGDSTRAGMLCYSGNTLIAQKQNLLEGSTVYGAWTLSSLLPETTGKIGFCKVFVAPSGEELKPLVIALRFATGGAFSTVPVRVSTEPVDLAPSAMQQ